MKRFSAFLLLVMVAATACHRVPDHARYIPKNATAVAGLNLGALGRKVAWSKISGSPLLAELERSVQAQGGAGLGDLQHSGLETGSILYVFTTAATDVDPTSGTRSSLTAVLPLDDADDWEAYLKKAFPGTAVAAGTNGRKETRLGANLFATWNADVAFVSTGERGPGSYVMQPDSTEIWQEGTPDAARTLASLRALFDGKTETSAASDTRFAALQKAGDDASLWVNYDAIMSRSGMTGMLGGLGTNLWKGAAAATGLNFQKGRVAMDLRYYTPEGLKDAYTEIGAGRVPQALLAKVPADSLGMVAAFHLSPKGLRMLLEKMGLLGLANMGLAAQGMNVDEVLDAFSGDFLLALNHFQIADQPADSLGETPGSRPTFNYLAVIGVKNQEKFNKLMAFVTGRQLLQQTGPDAYTGIVGPSGALVVKNGYAVLSDGEAAARASLAQTDASRLPEPVRHLADDGPIGYFANLQTLMAGVGRQGAGSPESAALLEEAKKRFVSVRFSGGRFKGDHMALDGELTLTDRNENALLQLLDFAAKAQALRRTPVAAVR